MQKILAPFRLSGIDNKDFTIICNNCWGGKVYQRYGLPYASPTVGLFFWAEDYIRFINNLKYYLSLNLTMIPATSSKHYDMLVKRNQLPCPIGVLDDVEIVFLHYKTDEEAIEKWERRKKRVNYDNLFFKFSVTNCCEDKHLEAFESFACDAKVAFVNTHKRERNQFVYVPHFENSEDMNDTDHYADHININAFLNHKKVEARKTPWLK